MILVADLRQVFADKLAKTGSLDAALTKAVWVAYKQGLADGAKPPGPEPVDDSLPR